MPNHLTNETSPYLRQHQDNPVDWYPWGPAALEKAQEEHKPIFLSIGYAACHWCHVMAHESFEDPDIARLLNDHFVSIKVDREERPDLDDIYMQAVVALTGQGGWPLSVFLTPDRQPFYGGTYFPPQPRYGMPSFEQILRSVVDVWQNRRKDAQRNARILTRAVEQQAGTPDTAGMAFHPGSVVQSLDQAYDWQNGGWGSAPKFPQPMVIEFLIQEAIQGNDRAQKIAVHALEQMSRGGLYDLAGGGFHRYSTDSHWRVPHFEKMLYDNALLSLAYLHAAKVTGKDDFRQVTQQTLDFLLREMHDPLGGFYASLDADSPGGEGRFYTWTLHELRGTLNKEQWRLLQETMILTESGNFEDGLNILQLKKPLPELAREMGWTAAALQSALFETMTPLLATRNTRERPSTDDKIITAWNALAIRAFAEAGVLLDHPSYLRAARDAANFILENMLNKHERLFRSWNRGKASHPGTLADYALFAWALMALYQVDFDPEWIPTIRQLLKVIEEGFSNDGPLYYDTAATVQDLILRPKNLQDNATPSGNAAAALALLGMGHLDENTAFLARVDAMIRINSQVMANHPVHHGFWLQAATLHHHGMKEIALVSDQGCDALASYIHLIRSQYRPFMVLAVKENAPEDETNLPLLLANKKAVEEHPTAYVCENFTCQSPVTRLEELAQALSPDHKLD
jgi:hypothetical protein